MRLQIKRGDKILNLISKAKTKKDFVNEHGYIFDIDDVMYCVDDVVAIQEHTSDMVVGAIIGWFCGLMFGVITSIIGLVVGFALSSRKYQQSKVEVETFNNSIIT